MDSAGRATWPDGEEQPGGAVVAPDPLEPLAMPRSSLLLLLAFLVGCQQADAPAADPAPPASADSAAASAAPPEADADASDEPVVLFLGDSITAGYGLDDPALAFPDQVEALAEAEGVAIEAVPAGVSGDTSAGGLRRLGWLLRRTTPDVLVLELGGNDGLRGLDLDALAQNLTETIELVREANPEVEVVLAAVALPPNYGDYGRDFAAVFPAVAEATGARLVSLLPEGFADAQPLLQSDGIHPTAEGQRVVAERVWPAVREAVAAVEG